MVLLLGLIPRAALGQYPRGQGGDDFNHGRPAAPSEPPRTGSVISNADVTGPLGTEDFQKKFSLTDAQAKEYAQAYDSLAAATKADREAARHRLSQLNAAVVARDADAMEYYRDRLKELAKTLKEQQSKFDERMKKLLTKDQLKDYKAWRKQQDDAEKNPAQPERKKSTDKSRPPPLM